MPWRLGFILAGLIIAAPCLGQTPPQDSVTVERCIRQHESARLFRLEEEWRKARDAMRSCAENSCPIAIRTDCQGWLSELAELMPTLILIVESVDSERAQLHLEIDGQPVQLPDRPGPIELAPGGHKLRLAIAGHAPIEREVLLEKGEKDRVLRIRFPAQPDVPMRPATVPHAHQSLPPALSHPLLRRPVPQITYVLSGAALAAFVVSGALLASSLNSVSIAEHEGCAPNCPSAVRASIRRRLLFVDISAGLGLLLGSGAVYTYLRRPSLTDAALLPALRLSTGSSELLLEGWF